MRSRSNSKKNQLLGLLDLEAESLVTSYCSGSALSGVALTKAASPVSRRVVAGSITSGRYTMRQVIKSGVVLGIPSTFVAKGSKTGHGSSSKQGPAKQSSNN